MGSWNAFEGTLRTNNSIAYVSPSFKGLTLHAMYSNGISNDDAKWNRNNHYYGIGAQYAGGPLTTSLSFEVRDNKANTLKAGIISDVAAVLYGVSGYRYKANYQVNAGAEYALRSVKLMLAYRYEWQPQYADTHTVGLSAKANLDSATTLMLGARYYYAKTKGDLKTLFEDLGTTLGYKPEVKGSVLTFNAAIEHAFSKRTTAYMYGSYADGGKGFKGDYNMYIQALQQAGGAGVSDPINFNGWQFGIGLTHAF